VTSSSSRWLKRNARYELTFAYFGFAQRCFLSFDYGQEPEPEIMNVYRQENAWTMHKQGYSLEAIAESQQVSPEKAKMWIEEYIQRELQREAGRFGGEPHWALCGGLLPFNTEWTQSGDKKYHPACWRKMTYGC
jgi:hypothetical protein